MSVGVQRGRVERALQHAAAVALAGVLAEAGIKELWIESGGVRRRLVTRETDLPGVLASCARGDALHADGLRVTVVDAALHWETSIATLAAALSAISR